MHCTDCNREFRIGDDAILELVDPDALDVETLRELEGNICQCSVEQLEAFAFAEKGDIWQSYYSRNRKGTIHCLAGYLDKIECSQIFSLGSGTGREIEYLLQFRAFDAVFCSDLSYTALQVVPYRLARFDVKLGLFTSDLNYCPIKSRDIPVVIVAALHHTQDMHAAIERLLQSGYHNILFVEPTDNWMMRYLARRGLAQRVEYSGVKPGRLELKKLRALCKKHHYRLAVTTGWAFPQDYFNKVLGRSKLLRECITPTRVQDLLFGLLDILSALTNLVKFGNVSIVHLKKLNR